MEIGEACAIADVDQETPKCNPAKTKTKDWKAIIHGIKGGEGSAATLKSSMEDASIAVPGYPAALAKGWDLFGCDQFTFPTQTHHLIPEKQLPDHKVTAWLTDSPKGPCKHPKYELRKDTNYDTNGAPNGYFMPFASTTHQWAAKASKQNAVCFEMMRRTKIQLHQGPHSRSTDYMEDLDIETAPYKQQVDEFLNEIDRLVFAHVDLCGFCKKGSKTQVDPLLSTVAMVEQVSYLMKVLTDRCHVAVSARAGAYMTRYYKGGVVQHPSKPFVTPSDFD
jgi:hypothetical protein